MAHHQGGRRDLCFQLLLIHLGAHYQVVSHQTESTMLLFLEFLSHLKERLATLEIYMIILKRLLFFLISMKILILGVLFMTVSILGGTIDPLRD